MDELELRDYFRVLFKRKAIVIVGLAVCVGAAVALTALATPVYESEAKLFLQRREIVRADEVAPRSTEENGTTGATDEAQARRPTTPPQIRTLELSQELLRTYAEVIRTTPVAERAVRSNDLPIDPTDLADGLQAGTVLDTQILRISFRHRDRALAGRAVNAIAEAFEDEVTAAEGPVEPGGEPALRVSLVQPAALPVRPISPRPRQNLALGGLLGLVTGSGLAFVLEFVDRSIRNKKDVEEHLGLPVLATIPRVRSMTKTPHLASGDHSDFAEAFRKLKTTVQLGDSNRPQTIVLTSTKRGDGTTTAALNLAAVYAYADSKTVLLEADLRSPQLHEVFAPGERAGLVAVLRNESPVEASLVEAPVPRLSCLPALRPAAQPVELLSSDRMRSLLDELRQRFETIVIDTPPILATADASTVAPLADGVIIVARMNETNRDELTESAELVSKIGARLLGVVIMDAPSERQTVAQTPADSD